MKWVLKIKEFRAFTIVELLIVIVVLGILAGITVIGYGTWQTRLAQSSVQSDLKSAAAAMEQAKNFGNGYPTSLPDSFESGSNVIITYASGGAGSYCIEARSTTNPSVTYYISAISAKEPTPGTCTSYSDDFAGSGAMGNIKTGSPILAWQSLNSSLGDWTRNSGGYATTTIAAGSSPMIVADFGKADVTISERVQSFGNAIYFRIVDGNDWLRVKTTRDALRAYLSVDKSINGTITTLNTVMIYNTPVLPAYIKVAAVGDTITTHYAMSGTWWNPETGAEKIGNSVTDSTNQFATLHGAGYAPAGWGSVVGVGGLLVLGGW